MKAMVVSPVGGRVPAAARRVLMAGGRRDLEAEEVAAYLGKLRDLVPDMPRTRKLSKLEVIQRVIRYICELETTLEKDDEHQHEEHDDEHRLDEEEMDQQQSHFVELESANAQR